MQFFASFFTNEFSPTKLIELRADIDAAHCINGKAIICQICMSRRFPSMRGDKSSHNYSICVRDRCKQFTIAQICFPWKWPKFYAVPTQIAQSQHAENKIIYSCNCSDHANALCSIVSVLQRAAVVTGDIDLCCIVHILSVHKWFSSESERLEFIVRAVVCVCP